MMDIVINPKKLQGEVKAIPSKSQAHRLLICAAFSASPTRLICQQTNADIEATAQCLRALGADISRKDWGYEISPISAIPQTAVLDCGESGSTLRFLLPIVGALGVDATFLLAGRLPQRPLSPLWKEMERMGCRLERPTPQTLRCVGRLKAGDYHISGSVSSQYISGLLWALSLIPGKSTLEITGKMESAPYIAMTEKALEIFGVKISLPNLSYAYPFQSPGELAVEGDWSNGAFFLAAGALGSQVSVTGLEEDSPQGDRAAKALLEALEEHITIDAGDIPDLVPILSVVAAAKKGAVFTNIRRLRLKESDRVASVSQMLSRLGIKTHAEENSFTVYPGTFQGCTIDSAADHRIAMAAAIAATIAQGPVTILGAQCVEKSYPSFWEDYKKSGGRYEQYLR